MRVVGCCLLVAGLLSDAGAFEKVALIDSFDFARFFDTESAEGTKDIADYCESVGANVLWWRSNGGALQRYPGREEDSPTLENPFCKIRLSDERDFYGWLRLDRGECDLMKCALGYIRGKGLGYGIHMSYEENHWSASTVGGWNARHPEYWVRTRGGSPWPGRCSMSFPEVFARKLRMIDELLAYEPESLYIDTWRDGGWSVKFEYVKPMVDAWRTRYGGEPPVDYSDPRWIELFAHHQSAYFRGIKDLIRARGGRTRLCVGLAKMDLEDTHTWKRFALDWKALAADGTIDCVVITSVNPEHGRDRVWDSTRAIYDYVMRNRGKAEVYFPCNMYSYHTGIPDYVKWTGLSNGEVAARMLALAREAGARGVVLECVDYRNYPDDVCAALKEVR